MALPYPIESRTLLIRISYGLYGEDGLGVWICHLVVFGRLGLSCGKLNQKDFFYSAFQKTLVRHEMLGSLKPERP